MLIQDGSDPIPITEGSEIDLIPGHTYIVTFTFNGGIPLSEIPNQYVTFEFFKPDNSAPDSSVTSACQVSDENTMTCYVTIPSKYTVVRVRRS
jgi:hypothetical protein